MKRLHANGGEQSEPTSGHIIFAYHCGTAPKPQSEATRTCLLVCVRGVRECATNSHSWNGSVIGGEKCQSANTNDAVHKADAKHV